MSNGVQMTTEQVCEFRVVGVPQTKGSARAFMRRGMRFPVITNDNPKCKGWQGAVADAAAVGMNGREPFAGAVTLAMTFYFPRPKGHFGTGKNAGILKASAPKRHTVKPDLDKIVRAVKDGMTGVVYRDDAQVDEFTKFAKRYADDGTPPGVVVSAAMETEIEEKV